MAIQRREIQARLNTADSEWIEVASGVDGDIEVLPWTPPYSGAWRFRQRVFDDELRASEWVESGPYLYVKEVDAPPSTITPRHRAAVRHYR